MDIIARDEWDARHARGFRAAPLPARELYLHHSVTIAPDLVPPFDDDDAAVRTLERIGQDRFGRGISYTFAVTPVGRVYEGHGVDRQGAHTGGRNTIARAICLVGDYDKATPPGAMVRAAAELVAHGHRAGWWPAALTGGHRDAPGASTACPGRHAHALIPEINRQAAAILAGELEDDMNDDDRRLLYEIRDELKFRHPNRVDYRFVGQPEPDKRGTDTLAGMAVNADARAFEARQVAEQARDHAYTARVELAAMREQLTTISEQLAARPQLDATAVARAALAEAAAAGVGPLYLTSKEN